MYDFISVCIQYTIMSADVPLCTVLDIDPDLVTAKYEAVTKQLHLYSCWHYLLSPFKMERGYQAPGGLDITINRKAPRGTMWQTQQIPNEGMPSLNNGRVFYACHVMSRHRGI